MLGTPRSLTSVRDEARILPRRHTAFSTTTTSEQELPGSFVGNLQIVIDCLAGLFAQLESDWPAGFLLSDRCPIRCVSAGGDIFDLDRYDVTATQLAVDRHCLATLPSRRKCSPCHGRESTALALWERPLNRARSHLASGSPKLEPIIRFSANHLARDEVVSPGNGPN